MSIIKDRDIFVVLSWNIDGDGIVSYGAYTSMDAAQIARQFAMSDYGKDVWVERTRLQYGGSE